MSAYAGVTNIGIGFTSSYLISDIGTDVTLVLVIGLGVLSEVYVT